MTGRPTRYPQRRQPAVDATAAMAFQAPAAAPMASHGQDPAPAAEGLPEGQAGTRDDERARLLRRIVDARVPHRDLCVLIVQAEGLSAFTTQALGRMARILDVIEADT